MAVAEQTPYIEYTANGATTSFALGFDCESKDHLIITVNGVEPLPTGWSFANGNVVFAVAPVNGAVIVIQRNTPFARPVDYQTYNNSFRAPAVNSDFDRIWRKAQELGVKDWLLGLKIQKFRDDVNLTALDNTLIQAESFRDETAVFAGEVQSNVTQSQTLLASTTTQASLAQGYADSANAANNAAQQVLLDVGTATSDVYAALDAQEVAVNNSLTAIAGGHKAYQTLAAAQAAQASLPANTIVEVTNDPTASNNGTYQWNGTTLTKSAYDPLTQAKSYTDASLPIVKYGNLYDVANNAAGVYVRNDGLVLVANADSIVAVVAVEAGKTYAIKAQPFDTAYLAVGLKADNNMAAGQATTKATLVATADANVKTFTVPAGKTYAIINIKVGTSFDVRTGFVVNEGSSITSTDPVKNVVQKARGAEIADAISRQKIAVLEAEPYVSENDLTILKVGNLYSQYTNGYYVVSGAGGFQANADSAVGYFAIEAGKTYAIKPGSFAAGYFSIILKSDNVVGTGTGTNVTASLTATADPNVKLLTIPANSTAKYALLNVKVATSFDIRSTLVVNAGSAITDTGAYRSVVTEVAGNIVRDEEARTLIQTVDNKIVSPLKDKKWVVVGDSITEVNFRTAKNYHAYVSDSVGGMTIYNYGQSGTGYYGRFNVDSTITQDPDYITVFFGTNDYGNSDPNNTKMLGQFGDTDSTTIAGCIYKCLNQLVTRFYNKRIAVFTPIPRIESYGSNATPNSRGFTLEDIADVIKLTADHLSIPCLDLYHESSLPVWVTAGNEFYFKAVGQSSPDGVHPNDAGHQILARKIQKFLEAI